MKKIVINKDIFIIEDFLSAEECSNLRSHCNHIQFEEAKVDTGNAQVVMKGIRNNDRYLYNDKAFASSIYERALPFLVPQIGLYEVSGLNELFRFYKYKKSHRLKMHRDGNYERNEQESSFYTFLIYLNDDFEGGETNFRNIGKVNPKAGSALVFLHPLFHEGKEVLQGKKYVLRTDVMYQLT